MSDITRLRGDIQAAEELLKSAKAEYEKSVIDALEKGTLIEREMSEWMPRCDKDGNLCVYCKACRAKFSHHLKTAYCPNCGAKMSNASYFVRFVDDTADEEQKTKPTVALTVPAKEEAREQINMLADLKGKGFSQRELAVKLGVTQTKVCNWNMGKQIIDGENLEKLRKLHASVFAN